MIIVAILLILSSLDLLLFGCVMACFDKDYKGKRARTIGYITMIALVICLIIGGIYE